MSFYIYDSGEIPIPTDMSYLGLLETAQNSQYAAPHQMAQGEQTGNKDIWIFNLELDTVEMCTHFIFFSLCLRQYYNRIGSIKSATWNRRDNTRIQQCPWTMVDKLVSETLLNISHLMLIRWPRVRKLRNRMFESLILNLILLKCARILYFFLCVCVRITTESAASSQPHGICGTTPTESNKPHEPWWTIRTESSDALEQWWTKSSGKRSSISAISCWPDDPWWVLYYVIIS